MTRHCGVSFLRHREIYPDADLIIGLGSCTATPRTHRNEFQPAIPRRVALLHCSLPLRQPHSFCTLKPNPSSYNQRAVTCPEFACLSPRAHSSSFQQRQFKYPGRDFTRGSGDCGPRIGDIWFGSKGVDVVGALECPIGRFCSDSNPADRSNELRTRRRRVNTH